MSRRVYEEPVSWLPDEGADQPTAVYAMSWIVWDAHWQKMKIGKTVTVTPEYLRSASWDMLVDQLDRSVLSHARENLLGEEPLECPVIYRQASTPRGWYWEEIWPAGTSLKDRLVEGE